MAPSLNLRPLLHFSRRVGIWKILALISALLNIKNLPFAWHLRLLGGLFARLRSSRVRLASKAGSAVLFQPIITSSRSGFLECDYNFHKSNSTYFSDFDVGRLELLVALCSHGIEKTRKDMAKEGKESFGPILGGVSCNFRREIKPYEAFEVWTRVLTWDDKWLYVIGHFVRKGAVKPRGYSLQPWRKNTVESSNGHSANGTIEEKAPHPAIFATGIAKYVCKKGRRTVPPERILQASELLPPKPVDHDTPPFSMTPNPEVTSIDAAATSVGAKMTPDNAGEVLAASLTANKSATDEWTWERVEKERQRGMKIAEMYSGLDMLNEEFTANRSPALARH